MANYKNKTRKKRDQFLKTQKILRLATIDSMGNPHIVPVWYMYGLRLDGNKAKNNDKIQRFYIGTNTQTQKAKNLKNNRRVSFCVDEGIQSPKIYGVMGIGTANLILEKKQVLKLAKMILCRYFKSLGNESAQELLADTNCIIEILPKKVSVWNY